MRVALLNTYSAEITAHAGLIVTVVIGLAAIIYQSKIDPTFIIGKDLKNKLVRYFPIAFLLSAIFYFSYRLVFWSSMASCVLNVPPPTSLSINETEIYWLHTQTASAFSKNDFLPSWFYSIDQSWFTGASMAIILVVVLLLIVLLDRCYMFRVKCKKPFCGNYTIKNRLYYRLSLGVILIFLVLISLLVLFPHDFKILLLRFWSV
jgi:hypothetical protein